MDQISRMRSVRINLHSLIYSIGLIQSRRFAPNNRNKFRDKSDLVEMLYTDNNLFRLRINQIRASGGPEGLKSISEDFGVGLSVAVASTLYNIKTSTIQRIIGKNGDKRPDWSCQTEDNRILVIESKGTISHKTSVRQLQRAILQKQMQAGNIRIASSSLLKENNISTVTFVDPPLEINNMDPEDQKKILRASHYESVFSFLGHADLSRYFSQMKRRLQRLISAQEQIRKDVMFFNIRDSYSTIHFKEKEIHGTFSEIEPGQYIFTGIDVDLISYDGFSNFQDYDRQIEEDINGNYFTLFKDGVLVVEIRNIFAFSDVVNIEQIKNYQDEATISDVDQMNEISFEKLIGYILQRNNFQNTIQNNQDFAFTDFNGYFQDRFFHIDLKVFKNPRSQYSRRAIEAHLSRIPFLNGKYVMITNADLKDLQTYTRDDIIVIDRNKLKQILLDHTSIVNYLI